MISSQKIGEDGKPNSSKVVLMEPLMFLKRPFFRVIWINTMDLLGCTSLVYFEGVIGIVNAYLVILLLLRKGKGKGPDY